MVERRRPPLKAKTKPALVIRLSAEQQRRFARCATYRGLKVSPWARMILLKEANEEEAARAIDDKEREERK